MNQTTSQDLVNVSAALATAVQGGFLPRQHAEGVIKKTLDLSGYNTPKPEKKIEQVNKQAEQPIVVETIIEETVIATKK